MVSPYIFPAVEDPELLKIYQKTKLEELIISVVCQAYGVTFEQINVRSRKRELVEPRQVIMTLVNVLAGYTIEASGEIVGRDHATVLSSKKSVISLLETDKEFRLRFIRILRGIGVSPEKVDKVMKRGRRQG